MKNLKMKEARTALGLSQQEVADKVGVSRQTINAIEKGTIIQRFAYALKFARF